jgi:hypothetical protein
MRRQRLTICAASPASPFSGYGFNTYQGNACIAFHSKAAKGEMNATATRRWARALQQPRGDVPFGDVAVVIDDAACLRRWPGKRDLQPSRF